MEKKNLKSLKKLSMLKSGKIIKIVLFLIGTIYFISSCTLVTCNECSEDTKEELRKIGGGDVSTYKSFMKKHPDPYYSCCNRNSIINSVIYSLDNFVIGSDNLEIITDYFSYNLSQDIKNEFMLAYWSANNREEIIQFLINQGCKMNYPSYCDSSFIVRLKRLHKLGYDMNYINPKYGTNLFLDFSAIGYEAEVFKYGDCAVECLKYLKSIGVDTKLKDNDGKTALELASDPVIINYLKSIE